MQPACRLVKIPQQPEQYILQHCGGTAYSHHFGSDGRRYRGLWCLTAHGIATDHDAARSGVACGKATHATRLQLWTSLIPQFLLSKGRQGLVLGLSRRRLAVSASPPTITQQVPGSHFLKRHKLPASSTGQPSFTGCSCLKTVAAPDWRAPAAAHLSLGNPRSRPPELHNSPRARTIPPHTRLLTAVPQGPAGTPGGHLRERKKT